MSVRKRKWKTRKGETKEAWIVDYFNSDGKRHIETFRRKKEAVAHEATVRVDVAAGVHTPPSKSITVKQAVEDWLAWARAEKLERGTIVNYEVTARRHIVPRLGNIKLASLTTPRIAKFRDDLLSDLSRAAAGYALGRLKAILKDAKRRGNVAQNAASDVQIRLSTRDKPKLRYGVDFPSREDVKRLVDSAPNERVRTLIMTAAFSGLRASELRGLRWQDADLARHVLHVHQRADRYNVIGSPKSRAGERDVPIPQHVVNTLKTWKLACPNKGDGDLVFGTSKGTPDSHANLLARIWLPLQIKAGVVNKGGKPKYPGLHCLRHFYASLCINREQDGGLELPPKTVQTLLGHASIVITLDRYGHLFPSDDNRKKLDEVARSIFAT
jgi:integrase